MATEENEHRTHFNVGEQFRDFEAEPPQQSWNMIRARLADDIPESRVTGTMRNLIEWFRPMNRLYPALTIVGLALIALFIWFSVNPSNHIKGQAFVNQDELTRGTAFLFSVHDKTPPYDSVRFYGKSEFDSNGHFAFDGFPRGSYLLRVHIHPDSPHYPQYIHGYYKDQLSWNKATLIHTDHLEKSYPVRVPKISSK